MKSKLTKVGYELADINIVQTECSFIEHRSECDTTIDLCGRKGNVVIASPMGAVTNLNNYHVWLDNGFICLVPRTESFEGRLLASQDTFGSFSLVEAKEKLLPLSDDGVTRYICIDIAHGTMSSLYNICKKLKDKFGENMVIMTGNVANPLAFPFYADCGIDYMRACIGTGSRCTTSPNVGVHYPTATLLDELRMEKEKWDYTHSVPSVTKIIADGGLSNFDDIQKCLALGADAVMSGQFFAKAEEACSPIVYLHPDNLNMADAISGDDYIAKVKLFEELGYGDNDSEGHDAYQKLLKRKPYREYYGMSTKRAQRETGGKGNRTAEGISRPIPVEYTIDKWADNMKSYLASAMSYTGNRTIEDLKRNTQLIINMSGDRSYKK